MEANKQDVSKSVLERREARVQSLYEEDMSEPVPVEAFTVEESRRQIALQIITSSVEISGLEDLLDKARAVEAYLESGRVPVDPVATGGPEQATSAASEPVAADTGWLEPPLWDDDPE